uniref:Uncharacterized protein n=1 Tax=Vombatus ursinus TaxID=29139 RepID=A0A4X2KUZ8_VOMUR
GRGQIQVLHPNRGCFLFVFIAEGCLGFYTTFAVLASRSPELLELDLLKYNPTTAEIQAFKKIQECYQESPLKSTFLDASFLVRKISISLSQECLESLKTPFF